LFQELWMMLLLKSMIYKHGSPGIIATGSLYLAQIVQISNQEILMFDVVPRRKM
jgi:MFS-type transporter involved in bile tolerance (Atg22 family)